MVETITNAVSTVGFPIVAFIVVCYFVKYIFDENNKTMNSTMSKLTDSVDELKDVIINTFTEKGDK